MTFLPFARPDIGEEEIAAVVEALRSGWITTGPRAREFEGAFANYVGSKHAVAVNSATGGLHLALEAIGVGPEDVVVTTPNTFTATAEVIRYLGAEIALADIDYASMNIDPQRVEDVVRRESGRRRVKALLPVHFGGQACDMAALRDIGRRFGLRVVEDAAHALPTTCDGRMVGTMADATVFSFYATKTLATGEGGMVTTEEADLAARMRVMRLHGISQDVWDRYTSTKPKWFYEVIAPGYKYNLTDVAAALGLQQLKRCDAFWQRRSAIAEAYLSALRDDDRLDLPRPVRADDRHAWHLFVIRLRRGSRDRLIERMSAAGIGTSVHFIPLHLHPYYRDRYAWQPDDFPLSLDSFRRSVSLPIYTLMTDSDVERVIAGVKQGLEGLPD